MIVRHRDDRGSAILTGVLISAVVLIMSIMATQLAIHGQQSSGTDRNRTQSIHAAEAGFDLAMSTLQSTDAARLPCTVTGTLNTKPQARYEATITYYASWPITSTPLICREPGGPSTTLGGDPVNPAAAVIEVDGHVGFVERNMEGAVRLSPVLGQFNKALFSDQSPTLENNLEVVSADAAPADIYTNGDWICHESIKVQGSVYARGRAELENTCGVSDHLWVRGPIAMANHTNVGRNAVTSESTITLTQSARVAGNAISAGTCTGCDAIRVGGTVSSNRGVGNVPSPPEQTMPVIDGTTPSWVGAGYAVRTFSDCGPARAFLNTTVTAKTVMRISPACDLGFSNNSTVTLGADLAIVTDGSITSERRVTFRSSDGTPRVLHLIVPRLVGVPLETQCAGTNGDIVTSNNTDFENIKFFVYSPCTVQFSNNNPTSAGQVYGGHAVIENLFSLQFEPIFVPGVPSTVVGYSTELAWLREVVG